MDKYFDIFVNCSLLMYIIFQALFEHIEKSKQVILKYILSGVMILYYFTCYILYCKGYGHFIVSIIFGILTVIFCIQYFIIFFSDDFDFLHENKYDYIIGSFILISFSIYFFINRLQMDNEVITKFISDFKNFSSLIINGLLSIEIDNDLIREIFIATIGSVLAGIVLKILIKK